jgi:hypothetical protein
VRIFNNGLVYVCDRAGDRIQVFTKKGKFLKEFHSSTRRWAAARPARSIFQRSAQRYIFVAHLVNATVWQLDRQSGEILGRVSHKGANPGELLAPHVAAMFKGQRLCRRDRARPARPEIPAG